MQKRRSSYISKYRKHSKSSMSHKALGGRHAYIGRGGRHALVLQGERDADMSTPVTHGVKRPRVLDPFERIAPAKYLRGNEGTGRSTGLGDVMYRGMSYVAEQARPAVEEAVRSTVVPMLKQLAFQVVARGLGFNPGARSIHGPRYTNLRAIEDL